MSIDINKETTVKDFSDLQSIYLYLEDNALNYRYPFQIGDIFRLLRDKKYEEKNTDEATKCQYEIDVFNFITYNGDVKPHFSKASEQGDVIEYPDLRSFNTNTFDYISKRLDTTNNPLLKSRYAHILWESPRKHSKYARSSIDAYLDLIKIYETKDKKQPTEHYGLEVLGAIRNAYFLARQINDKAKMTIIKSEIKRLINDFDPNSTSAFTLRADLIVLMLEEKKVFTKDDFIDIETICSQIAENLFKVPDFHGAIDMFKIGEKISIKLGKTSENWTRRIAESYEALLGLIKTESMLSLDFCRDALVYYRKIKDKRKIEELEKTYFSLKTSVKFHRFEYKDDVSNHIKECISIAKKVVQQHPEDIIKILSLDNSLLPLFKDVEKFADNERNQIPILYKLQSSITDQYGHTVQHLVTDDEKKYYGMHRHYKEQLEMKIYLINAIFFEAIKQRKFNISALLLFFRKYSWFGRTFKKTYADNQELEHNWLNLLIPSLNEYFTQLEYAFSSGNEPNFVLSIDSLSLKIEGLMRDMLIFTGVSTFYFMEDEHGKQVAREKDIGALLHDEKMKELFDEDDLLFFRFLLVEKAGHNLRHRIAHSLLLYQEYHINFMHLLILALLKLGKYDFKTTTDERKS